MNERDTLKFLTDLQWTARSWSFREPGANDTPDEYAEALADHIARQLVAEEYEIGS